MTPPGLRQRRAAAGRREVAILRRISTFAPFIPRHEPPTVNLSPSFHPHQSFKEVISPPSPSATQSKEMGLFLGTGEYQSIKGQSTSCGGFTHSPLLYQELRLSSCPPRFTLISFQVPPPFSQFQNPPSLFKRRNSL